MVGLPIKNLAPISVPYYVTVRHIDHRIIEIELLAVELQP
jgi:hypothetical protein